ncbi:hypothetical protein ACJX0J_041244, partial [Zea mays]
FNSQMTRLGVYNIHISSGRAKKIWFLDKIWQSRFTASLIVWISQHRNLMQIITSEDWDADGDEA